MTYFMFSDYESNFVWKLLKQRKYREIMYNKTPEVIVTTSGDECELMLKLFSIRCICTGPSVYVYIYINNLREKFSPGPGFEPGSPALRAGAKPLSHPGDPLDKARILLLLDPHHSPGSTLVPSIRNGGEHLHWHFFNQGFYVNDTYRQDFKYRIYIISLG